MSTRNPPLRIFWTFGKKIENKTEDSKEKKIRIESDIF